LSRLGKLSPWDMERQLKIISLAMDASTPIEKAKKNICVNVGALCPGEKTANEVSNCAVDGLNNVFCGLVRDKNGNVDFVSHNYSIYQGLCGVLCMYASLFRKTGKDIYKDFLYRYYEKVRNVLLESDSKILLTDKNSSLGDGITGMISCIGHIGKLVEDSSFISDARALTDRLEFAENISNTDYLNGIGALLPLLEKLDSGLFSHASTLLLPLFESASPFTTGMAHGGSGVAVSLCALNKSKKSPKIEDRILSLLQWENSHYSENDNNWFDLRDKTKKGFMGGWCSGAPGIGMARRYIEKNTNNVDLKNICKVDIERVNRFLEERTEYKRDTLCCGTSSALMVSSFMGASAHRLYKYLCDAEKRNAIRVFNVASTCDKNVSLMQGMAGIAYALAMYGDALCGGMLI
jgi:lantibiotic modifying enzyme